jgi:WD40 repeat protein/beta-lactamase regulating signal transducer with metallopeptidase domain
MKPLSVMRDLGAQLAGLPDWGQLLTKVTLFLAVAWLVHFRLARANPRWKVLLWRTVVLGMAIVAVWGLGIPSLEIRLPPLEVAARETTDFRSPIAGETPAITPREFADAIPDPMERAMQPGEVAVESRPQAVQSISPKEAPQKTPRDAISWPVLLLGVWGCGAALLAARLALGLAVASRLLRMSASAPQEIAAHVGRIAAALGCRRKVQVRTSPVYAVPFQYGLWRPILVLPEPMCGLDQRGQLTAVIVHELTHVRSGDFGWNLVLEGIRALLWFHPLVWQVCSAHRAACDAVCDGEAAAYTGDVQAYCRTLASVALAVASPLPALGVPMARTSDVRSRIARLENGLSTEKLSRRALLAAALAILPLAALLAITRLASAVPPLAGSAPGIPPATMFGVGVNSDAGLVGNVTINEPSGSVKLPMSTAAAAAQSGVDLYGDPLPRGAIARLGAVRYRAYRDSFPQAIAFPDNKKVLALTWDFELLKSCLCWWDAADGRLARTVWPADDRKGRVVSYPLAGAITPDGKIAAARIGGAYYPSVGGKPVEKYWIKWWAVDSGRELASIPYQDPKLSAELHLALAWDGKTAATASQYGIAAGKAGPGNGRIWDQMAQKQTAAFDAKGYVWDLAISHSGKIAAFITDEDLMLWDIGSGQAPRTVIAKSVAFRPGKMAFSPDGKTLVVAGYPSQIRFLDAASGQLLRTLPTSDWSHSAVTMMTFSSNGKQLALGEMHESGARIVVWDLASDKPRCTLETPSRWVHDGAFSPDGQLFAATTNGLIDVWDLRTGKRFSAPFIGHHSNVDSIACIGHGGLLATASGDDTLRLWEARTGRQKTSIPCRHSIGGLVGFERGLAVSPDGKLLASFSAGKNNSVRVWDVDTGMQVHELAGRTKIAEVRCLGFSADGKRLAGASDDGKVRAWNVEQGSLLSESDLQLGLEHPLDRMGELRAEAEIGTLLQRAAFLPDLDCLVVNGSLDKSRGTIRKKFSLYSVPTGQELRTFGDNKLTKFGMTLSPDGKRLLSEEYSITDYRLDKQQLRLWDVAEGKEIWQKDLPKNPGGHQGPLAFSTDGRRFAVAVWGEPTEIWVCDTATGGVVQAMKSDTCPSCICFTSDGNRLATGMMDGTALVWDVSQSVSAGY